MKINLFYHKNIHRRKVKVTCSPERQVIEDQFLAEDIAAEAAQLSAAEIERERRRERIARMIKEDLDARNNRS